MQMLIAALLLAPQGTALGPSARLWQSQAFNGERCGSSLAVSGDRVIVGAPYKDENENVELAYGAAHVFHFDGATWTEEAVLEELPQLAETHDYVGSSVALQGDTAYVAIPGADTFGPNTNTGAILVFERATSGTWSLTDRIYPAGLATGDHFGNFALDGDVLVGMAPFDDDRGQDAGAAYVMRRIGGVWVEEAKLLAPDGQAGDSLSHCAIEGDLIVLSSPQATDALGQRAGAAYAFRHGPQGWAFEQKLVASDGSVGDRFGEQVTTSDGIIVLGAPDAGPGSNGSSNAEIGAVYTFERNGSGVWVETDILTSPDAWSADRFGAAVSLTRGRLAVGDPSGRTNGSIYGVVHFFERTLAGWSHVARLLEPLTQTLDQFGGAVHVGPNSLVVGVPQGGALGAYRGGTAFVYPLSEIFQRYCDPAVPTTAGTSAEMDAFGSSFVVDNDLRLECSGMPANVFGYFIAGDQFAFVPGAGGSFGDLCVGGQVLRFNDVVPNSGPSGSFERVVDLTQVPVIGAFSAGAPWYFQAWFRDGNRSNLSNAVIVPFR